MSNKKNQEISCPVFNNKRVSFVEWKGKVDDWIGVVGGKVKNKGVILRSVLTGEAWNLVSGIPGEDIRKEDGWKEIIEIMDKKYGEDKKERKMRKIKKCNGCERNGHEIENCWFKNKKCYKCQRMGHVASQCNKEDKNEGKEMKKEERIFYEEEREGNEDNFENICGIIDTGCRPTIVGEL